MVNPEKFIKGLKVCSDRLPGEYTCYKCPYEVDGNECEIKLAQDVLTFQKEQEEVEATINEDYEIFCGNCGENVGIIGRSVNLKVCSNYCPNCGKKVKRPKKWYET